MLSPLRAATLWWDTELGSPDPVARNWASVNLAVVLLPCLYALLNPHGIAVSLMDTCWLSSVFSVGLLATNFLLLGFRQDKTATYRSTTFLRVLTFTLLAFSCAVNFDSASRLGRLRFAEQGPGFLWDDTLMSFDTAVFGFVWPRGQLTLWLDTNETIGVTSTVALYYTEVLQTFYVSYYVWVFGILIYWGYYRFVFGGHCARTEQEALPRQWRRLQMLATGCVATYTLNFALNVLVPAVSPRIAVADSYEHDIRGIYLANVLRGFAKNAAKGSFGAFPSGHCGCSWVAASMARRSLPGSTYATFATVAAGIITAATLVLRYHYVADVVFAVPMYFVGASMGSLLDQAKFDALLDPPVETVDSAPAVPLEETAVKLM